MAVVQEVALLRQAEGADGKFELIRPSNSASSPTGPAIKLPFVAFAVGVLGGIEAALGMGHVPQHVV